MAQRIFFLAALTVTIGVASVFAQNVQKEGTAVAGDVASPMKEAASDNKKVVKGGC